MDVTALARSHTETAIKALVAIVGSEKKPAAARVAASVALLDRGWGKPSQPVAVSGALAVRDDRPPLGELVEQFTPVASTVH